MGVGPGDDAGQCDGVALGDGGIAEELDELGWILKFSNDGLAYDGVGGGADQIGYLKNNTRPFSDKDISQRR